MNNSIEQRPCLPANWEIADDGSIHYRTIPSRERRTILRDNPVASQQTVENSVNSEVIHREDLQVSKKRKACFWFISMANSILLSLGIFSLISDLITNVSSNGHYFYCAVLGVGVLCGPIIGGIMYGILLAKKTNYNLTSYFLSILFDLAGIPLAMNVACVIAFVVVVIGVLVMLWPLTLISGSIVAYCLLSNR